MKLKNSGENWDIGILYEDERVIVVNKPAGISMHAKNVEDQAETVESIFRSKLAKNDPVRGGIVHRIDKDTSGVVIMAKTTKELEYLQQQFSQRKVDKKYLALVWGHLKHQKARIELPIKRSNKSPNKMSIDSSGKMSISEYEVMSEYKNYSLLSISIYTGRTHQIRVQLAHMGHSVVGDKLYSSKSIPNGLSRQFLHAQSLSLDIDNSGIKRSFEAPLAEDLKKFLDSIDE